MAFEHEQRQAMALLKGIEDGTMTASQSFGLIEDADATLVYFIFTWLREHYRDHPAAEGVIGRIVAITDKYSSVTRTVKEGQADSVVTWFEDNYSYRDLRADNFIAQVVEKLEG